MGVFHAGKGGWGSRTNEVSSIPARAHRSASGSAVQEQIQIEFQAPAGLKKFGGCVACPRNLWLMAAWVVCAGGLSAQTGNPLSTELLQSYTGIKTSLLKMAEKMPEDAYSFKPTPEVETFARRVAHIAGANFRTCAGLKGESRSLNAFSKTTKADLVAALQESFAYCDGVFQSLTDATAVEMVPGRIGSPPTPTPRTRLSTMWNVVRHSNEMYGYMAVYLRLKGVVPPTSSRE
jgi:hypothetical protein